MNVVTAFLVFLSICTGFSLALSLQPDGTCALAVFIPFTDARTGPPDEINVEGQQWYGHGQWSSPQALGKAAFSLLATAQMAQDHFNQRISSIVPELENYRECNVTLSDGWYLDSAYSRSVVFDTLLTIGVRGSSDINELDRTPCAVIGPIGSLASEGASAITGNLGIPQIAYTTNGRQLARQDEFPSYVQAIPSIDDFSQAIGEYIQRDVLRREFVGIIYEKSEYGEQFRDSLKVAGDGLGYTALSGYVVEGDGAYSSMYDSLSHVVDAGFHTVVFASERPAILDDIASVGNELGIVGDEYFWLFTGEVLPPELFSTLRFEVDSPEDKILRGAAVITNYDPFVYDPKDDRFLETWRVQSDDQLHILENHHPLNPSDSSYYIGGPGYFEQEDPTEYASFLYDAIVNAGMAACRALDNGNSHHAELLTSNFQGASGHTTMKENKNSRGTAGVKFGAYNIRPGEIDIESNTRSYTRHLTAIYNGNEQSWSKIEGEDFIFYDGTTDEPVTLTDTSGWIYLSDGFQRAGIIHVMISEFHMLLTSLWVFIRRKTRIFTAAQPEFLYLICLGGALMSSSLLCISFDERNGWTLSQLDKGCAAFPWLFVLGYLCQYCAIFNKLWRLSKLLSLRRRAISFRQAILPFAVIITSSIAVLIVWQVVDPLRWNRSRLHVAVSEFSLPSTGGAVCENDDSLPFILALGVLFAGSTLITLVISWKMRNVQEDLAESRWIFTAVLIHLLIWPIVIQTFIVADIISRDAFYFVSTGVISIFTNIFTFLLIWPRCFTDVQTSCFGSSSRNQQTRITLSGGTTHVSGINSARIHQIELLGPSQQTTTSRLESNEANNSKCLSVDEDEFDMVTDFDEVRPQIEMPPGEEAGSQLNHSS